MSSSSKQDESHLPRKQEQQHGVYQQQNGTPLENNLSFASLFPRVISGSIGAIVTSLTVTPLDVVKVRQQASSLSTQTPTKCPDCGTTFLLNNGLMECAVSKKSVPYFDNAHSQLIQQNKSLGTFRLLRRIFTKEGLPGIYAGLSPTLVMSVPNTVLYFTTYDEIVSRLRGTFSHPNFDHVVIPLIGGSSARLFATVVTSPLELIRTRRANNNSTAQKSHTLLQEIRLIIRNGGFLSLYKGLAPTLWRDVPFSAIYWLCLEHFKRLLQQQPLFEGNEERKVWSRAFLSGMGAGVIASAFTTPFDVVKTRQQVASSTTASLNMKQKIIPSSSSSVKCNHVSVLEYQGSLSSSKNTIIRQMKHIVEIEGLSGLWRGNQTRMMRVAPACAIMISCYELGKKVLGSY